MRFVNVKQCYSAVCMPCQVNGLLKCKITLWIKVVWYQYVIHDNKFIRYLCVQEPV